MLPTFLKRFLPGDRRTSVPPSALETYMALRKKPDRSAPIGSVRFVVFDTETSGLDFATNRLLSIAGVALHGYPFTCRQRSRRIVEVLGLDRVNVDIG